MKKALGLRLNLNGKHVSNSWLDEENYVIVGTTTFVQRKDSNKPYTLHFGGIVTCTVIGYRAWI